MSSWGWRLGRLGGTSVVIEESPALLRDVPHDRRRAGLNHVAFAVPARSGLDEIVRRLPAFGWSPLFADRYPHAGGPDHYAAYLENDDGFERYRLSFDVPGPDGVGHRFRDRDLVIDVLAPDPLGRSG